MWDSLGLCGLLALVLLSGGWLAFRLYEENEHMESAIASLPPKEQHQMDVEDDPDENRLYWLTEKGWDQ